MTLTITIEMDNAAFGRTAVSRLREVRRILGELRALLTRKGSEGTLRDSNGNTVGEWRVSE